MNELIAIYKKIGETPLQALERLRATRPQYGTAVLSYAGRLDPLARGVMLVLVGDANLERQKYLSLDKTYFVRILFGIATDTQDVLGVVRDIEPTELDTSLLQSLVNKNIGKFAQSYPAFSAKTVGGVALHTLSRSGSDVSLPEHNVEIYQAELVDTGLITKDDIYNETLEKISLVTAPDFRQKEILRFWKKRLKLVSAISFPFADIRLTVSSGFYVRQYASDLGAELGLPALAYQITREKVGQFGVGDCVL